MTWKERYQQAHEEYFKAEYPLAYKDGHYIQPVYPDVRKANGLTAMCVNYLKFVGAYGNRINTMGRLIDGTEKQASGTILQVKKWLPSTTKRGTADIHGIYQGRHLSIEVKIGKDRMSEHQHKEKIRIERAGGLYWIVKTAEDFFTQLDNISTQNTLF